MKVDLSRARVLEQPQKGWDCTGFRVFVRLEWRARVVNEARVECVSTTKILRLLKDLVYQLRFCLWWDKLLLARQARNDTCTVSHAVGVGDSKNHFGVLCEGEKRIWTSLSEDK